MLVGWYLGGKNKQNHNMLSFIAIELKLASWAEGQIPDDN